MFFRNWRSEVKKYREWKIMAENNAAKALEDQLKEEKNDLESIEALSNVLDLSVPLEKIECFDISHSSGMHTKASCVVFGPNGPIKKQYRQFNIDNITPGDDYAAMRQVLLRRYSKNKALPNMIIVDGGKGQLNQAVSVLKELNIENIILLGVAKGEGRKPGLEKLYFFNKKAVLHLKSDHPALHYIQFIRDEAHRFAITAHRKAREKSQFASSLENIAGIGKKRRLELLRYFGGLHELKKASVTEILRVPGISEKLAKKIVSNLQQ